MCGAIGFLLSGSILNVDIPLSYGFINVPAFLIFIPITMFMARIGANQAHEINKTKLQVLFGIFLYVVGTIFVFRYYSTMFTSCRLVLDILTLYRKCNSVSYTLGIKTREKIIQIIQLLSRTV